MNDDIEMLQEIVSVLSNVTNLFVWVSRFFSHFPLIDQPWPIVPFNSSTYVNPYQVLIRAHNRPPMYVSTAL